jgi:uncharacterized protein
MSQEPWINPDHCAYKLRLGESKIHRWGIYAAEDIPKNRRLMEYTGERISRRETKHRCNTREFNYLFTLDSYWTIDGSVGGSGAQYINHSCEPNVISRIVKGRILYFSKRAIREGEELTLDYHFSPEVEEVPCGCGADACRGTINLHK